MNDAAGVAVCDGGNDLLEFVPRVTFPHTTVCYKMICVITHTFTVTRESKVLSLTRWWH